MTWNRQEYCQKLKFLGLCVLFTSALQTWAQSPSKPDTVMPEERVRETFSDARVKSFLKMAEKTYAAKCQRPAAAINAAIRSNGTGDFSSTFYDFKIQCSNSNKDGLGLTAVGINAEFSPPRPNPLNLILSVHLKE